MKTLFLTIIYKLNSLAQISTNILWKILKKFIWFKKIQSIKYQSFASSTSVFLDTLFFFFLFYLNNFLEVTWTGARKKKKWNDILSFKLNYSLQRSISLNSWCENECKLSYILCYPFLNFVSFKTFYISVLLFKLYSDTM